MVILIFGKEEQYLPLVVLLVLGLSIPQTDGYIKLNGTQMYKD